MRTTLLHLYFTSVWMISCAIATAEPPASPDEAKPPMAREIAPGVVELQGIRIDKNKQTATVQAEVALTEGILEYALVNAEGKVYESLLSTKAEPIHLHAAMLLLGAPDAEASETGAPPGQITSEFLKTAPPIVGDPLELTIRWVDPAGKTIEQPLSSWIKYEIHQKELPPGGWLYNGSMLSQGKFLAQVNLSIISLISDPSALANQTSPGHDEADAWSVNKKNVPPEKTPVELIFHLLPKETADQ